MARRRSIPKPKDPKKGSAFWYAETPAHSKKVIARLTEHQAKNLRRLARKHECLVMDQTAGHPVPSTRAIVQAIAEGRFVISPAPAAPPAPPPAGACPPEKE